ncbi:MAG: ATP-binding protein, partial [Gammaproteobacteria bacterium]|nr:ATP-binding protein [Gammaproteobacteria bacterium]
ILKVKKDISRHDLNKADYFKLVTEKSSDEIAFHSLSPGEQLELMTLTWLFNINFTHEKKAILLLDEPDAHLHPSLTHQVIREIKNRIVDVYGIQVIMTTHNPVTISMPEVENHLFLMTDDNAERRIELNQARRRDINQYLMPYLISVNPSFKLVFVEADNDIKFYNLMYQKILTPTSNLTAPLFFTAHGRPNTIGTAKKESKNELDEKIFEEKGEASSRGLVIRLVKKCVPESEDDTTLKDFMYGIVDNDNQDISTLPDNVYSPQRYNIENYICDPLNVFFNLLERDPENNYTLKLISEIFKVKKESSQEEEILWTREIYLDVNRETKKLKYSVLSLDGNRIDGDLNIESEILPSTEDFVKKFKRFLKDKEDKILNELSSKNLIHRHFKGMSLSVMKESQAILEKDDPTFCFPKSFYEFSLLSQNQKTVIAQKIIDEMAKLFYYKLETYPDNTYRFMIKNPRFRSKLIENKSQNLNKTPMPVYFLSEMELHYPKIFLHMQGHYLEKLYIQFFGMFAGKASILEFMKKNDVLIPQEFHQIFLGISNDGYSFTLQRTEYLKKIEEKEAILRQWPLVLRKNENQAKEIDSFKKIQAKHKEQIEKLKKENRELKMAAAHSNIATANSSDPTFFGRTPPLSLSSNTPPLQQGGNLTNHN